MCIARATAAGLLLFAAMLTGPPETFACSCIGGVPLCETFWKTPVVFAGEVLEIRKTPNELGSGYLPDRLVRFRVDEAWRGDVSGAIEIRTGSGGGDCGFDFQTGQRYLVFAHQWKGALSTNICSPTKLLSDAKEALAFLRRLPGPSAGGRIYGTATYRTNSLSNEGVSSSRPVVRYTVTLRGEGREWRTTTNDEGSYEFTGIPAGTYALQLMVPSTEHAYGATKVELADPRGCAKADLSVVPNGRVSLRLRVSSLSLVPFSFPLSLAPFPFL
jgi:hypothetical protein